MIKEEIERLTKLMVGGLFFITAVAIFIAWLLPNKAQARREEPQCKHENSECEINDSDKTCCEGLVCVIFNEQSGNRKCVKIEPTATPSATLVPPTPTPVEATSTPRVEPTGLPEVPFPQPCNGCNIAPQIPAEESKGLLGHPNMGGK